MNVEVHERHTRILRLTLAVAESRAYWSSVDPTQSGAARIERAFNERWFGYKSLARVKLLLTNFATRFDAYPTALEALRHWSPEAPATRSLVCHWHLQLSDPLYRSFTGSWLTERRLSGRPQFDTDIVARALVSEGLDGVAPSTRQQYAMKLMRAADEAGLISPSNQGPRTALAPRVPDEALGYLVRVLRQLSFSGDWRDNPYFRSVGLDADAVDARLRRLPDVSYQRMGELVEVEATPLEALR